MAKNARLWFIALLLVALDAMIALVCVPLAYKLRFFPHDPWVMDLFLDLERLSPYLHLMIFAPVVRVLSSYAVGVYETRRKAYRISDDVPKLLAAVSLGSAILILIAFFGVFQYRSFVQYREFNYSRFFFVFEWLLNLVFVIGVHTFIGISRNEVSRRGVGIRHLAIQGCGKEALALAGKSEVLAEAGYAVMGFISEPCGENTAEAGNQQLPLLGRPSDVHDIINDHHIEDIVVTDVASLNGSLVDFCGACHKLDVLVKLIPDMYGILFQGHAIEELAGMPVFQVNQVSIGGFARVLKRTEDILLAVIGLALASPILLASALLIRIESPGPIFFIQRRTGKNGRVFCMYKFRSMYADAEKRRKELEHLNESDGPVFKIKNDPRITRTGRILRKASIDELPQLLNVLKGEMSFVGPRPLPVCDIAKPDEWEQRRFAAMPGITGLWQVNRTNHTSEEMLKWDLYYVEHWSLWLDLKILFKTVAVVLMGRGAY